MSAAISHEVLSPPTGTAKPVRRAPKLNGSVA